MFKSFINIFFPKWPSLCRVWMWISLKSRILHHPNVTAVKHLMRWNKHSEVCRELLSVFKGTCCTIQFQLPLDFVLLYFILFFCFPLLKKTRTILDYVCTSSICCCSCLLSFLILQQLFLPRLRHYLLLPTLAYRSAYAIAAKSKQQHKKGQWMGQKQAQ